MEDPANTLTEHDVKQIQRLVRVVNGWDVLVHVVVCSFRTVKWLFQKTGFLSAAGLKWAASMTPIILIAERLGWLDLAEYVEKIIDLLP